MHDDTLIPCRTWDCLLWLDHEALEEAAATGESSEEVRCRMRIDGVEQALARSRSDPFIAMFGLHDDLERRRAYWADQHHTGRRAWSPARLILTVLLIAGAVVIGLLTLGALGIVAILLFFPFAWTGGRTRRHEFDESTCPDCGYDISRVPDDIPRERVNLRTGPRACPECGCAWPLVPPPA